MDQIWNFNLVYIYIRTYIRRTRTGLLYGIYLTYNVFSFYRGLTYTLTGVRIHLISDTQVSLTHTYIHTYIHTHIHARAHKHSHTHTHHTLTHTYTHTHHTLTHTYTHAGEAHCALQAHIASESIQTGLAVRKLSCAVCHTKRSLKVSGK
jgi:hypothetical protein